MSTCLVLESKSFYKISPKQTTSSQGVSLLDLFEKADSSGGNFYVTADRLVIGLYVFIDLPWLSHPFALNSFRIGSEKQILELRSLGVQRFRCDPMRSEIESDQMIKIMPPGESMAASLMDKNAKTDAEGPMKPQLGRSLTDYRSRFKQVESAFVKSTQKLRELNRDLQHKPDEALSDVMALVDVMVSAFLNSTEITLHVMSEKYCGTEWYSHGLNVTVLGMMLSRSLKMTPEQARDLGLGALMHDIGKAEVPEHVLRKRSEEHTKPERDLYALHCEFGARVGTKLGLSPEVLGIILQHHEMADGTGYPGGVSLDRISLPSRIVALVNHYDNLCNPVDPAQAMTPHEALSLMFAQRRTKFDLSILQQLIRSLGVYPPGSLVTLSNGAIGGVVSVNPSRSLRPVVMVYDAAVPKEDAIFLDLATEEAIGIVRAISPKLLPPAICAYLSPRRRVSYYFDGSPHSPLTDQVSA